MVKKFFRVEYVTNDYVTTIDIIPHWEGYTADNYIKDCDDNEIGPVTLSDRLKADNAKIQLVEYAVDVD